MSRDVYLVLIPDSMQCAMSAQLFVCECVIKCPFVLNVCSIHVFSDVRYQQVRVSDHSRSIERKQHICVDCPPATCPHGFSLFDDLSGKHLEQVWKITAQN